MELSAFTPFCRTHSTFESRPREPLAFGEAIEAPIRTLLTLRQQLIPYLYSLVDECDRRGAPILGPLLFEFPADAESMGVTDQFLLDSALLVAPVTAAGKEHRHVYLPPGPWFHPSGLLRR